MIERANGQSVTYVWNHMREEDRTEITAAVGHCSPELRQMCLAQNAIAFVVLKDHEPVAIFGAESVGHGVARMFRFATPRWPEVVKETIRYSRRVLLPGLQTIGFDRLEANTLDIPEATAWLRLFGAKKERTYGKNGRDFAVYGLSLAA